MARGVYPRKREANSEQPPAISPQPVAQQDLIPPVQLVAPAFLTQPNFYRNQRVAVDKIGGADLKAYARSIGITQRDVDGLTEDRLRQNCKARIAQSMED